MPTPKAGESEKDFMGRCMSWPDLQGKEQDQRAAICYSKFEDKEKNALVAGLAETLMNKPAESYEKEEGGEGFFTHCIDSGMCADADDEKACCAAIHEKHLGYSPGPHLNDRAKLPALLANAAGVNVLNSLVSAAVQEDLRFKTWGAAPGAYVADLIAPGEDGPDWRAVVRTSDGEMVKVSFTVENGEVVLSDDEPEKTELVYNRHLGKFFNAPKPMVQKTEPKKVENKEETRLAVLANRGYTHLDLNAVPLGVENKKEGEEPMFNLPDDGWYQIAPKGEHPHPSTGLVQVIDDAALESIVNRFGEEKKADNFPGLLVDFDHFSQSGNTASEAAGWIVDLDNRDDGLWAQVRWTDKGKEAVANGRYRLASPVWRLSDCEELGNEKVRPMRLDTVALTNQPNLKGLVPLSNDLRAEVPRPNDDGLKAAAGKQGTTDKGKDK